MLTSDIEDAFQVVLIIANCDDVTDNYYNKIKNNWDITVSKMSLQYVDLSFAMKVRKTNHGRKVFPKYLQNPILIGRTKNNNLIALDGNHRLIQHIENQTENIPVYILDISWLDDADDMEFD